MKKIQAYLAANWFLLALAAMILLAYAFPAFGTGQGSFSLSAIAGYGVSAIFFFYGARQDLRQFLQGLTNWRMHLMIQGATFLLFPLIALSVRGLFHGTQAEIMWLGIFYLAALPSTVSSSVVMVSIAKGNVPAAIFNASISGILGVFITPVWMSLFFTGQQGSIDAGAVIGKLMLQILLPVALGMLSHSFLGSLVEKNKNALRIFDQCVILLIVYTSFCHSFVADAFSGYRLLDLLWLGAGTTALFFLVFALLDLASRFASFSRADRSTVVFCGSKKSLVHGSVMATVFFPHSEIAGLVLLPLMIYHALQLVFASAIAKRIAGKG